MCVVRWGRARNWAGLVVEAVILGSPGLGLEVEVGGRLGKESVLRQVPTAPVESWAGVRDEGGSGAAGMGRCSAGRSREPGIGVRECAVGSGTAESGTDSSFPTPWRLAGAEGRENRGASLWFLFHPRSRGMAFAKVCPSKSADPCALCPSRSTALSCRAVGEVRSGCRRSFRGVLGKCGRPRPARPLGRPGEDLSLEMRSPLPSQPTAGREEGSKDQGRARRSTAGLEGPGPGSKACGWAQGSPGWGPLGSSLEGGRRCSAVGPPPAACSSSSSVRLDWREAQ